MSCCRQCIGIEKFFDQKTAEKNLKRYLKRGARKPTQMLIDAIKEHHPVGSLLDIGGGIGAIQLALLQESIEKVTNVDASNGYMEVAKGEAEKRGVFSQIQYEFGDFVDVAEQLEKHTVVTLDKVICCYPDMVDLVRLSSDKSEKYYGLVYPKYNLFTKMFRAFGNTVISLFNKDFRSYLHSNVDVRSIVDKDFKEVYYRTSGVWQIVLFERIS
jgi:Methyltransferase domain